MSTSYDGAAPTATSTSSAAGASASGTGTAPAGERASIGELFTGVSEDITLLLRQEVELAKAEVTQSVKKAGKGAGMFAGAGLAGHFVLLFLSIALWWGIGDHTGYGWSALIVAALWALIAAVLAVVGRGEFTTMTGMKQTTDTVKKIPNAVKGNEEFQS